MPRQATAPSAQWTKRREDLLLPASFLVSNHEPFTSYYQVVLLYSIHLFSYILLLSSCSCSLAGIGQHGVCGKHGEHGPLLYACDEI